MTPSHSRTQNRARGLRLHEHRPAEPRRAGEPSDYPRGYIEQLARTFSGAKIGSAAATRRRRTSRTSAADSLG
jgi:hypothetical protein